MKMCFMTCLCLEHQPLNPKCYFFFTASVNCKMTPVRRYYFNLVNTYSPLKCFLDLKWPWLSFGHQNIFRSRIRTRNTFDEDLWNQSNIFFYLNLANIWIMDSTLASNFVDRINMNNNVEIECLQKALGVAFVKLNGINLQ